jgi:UDP-N-acetyl-D-mannosaminuronic acid dehydrogenase
MRVTIIGGCGHVGLPLGVALASEGVDVTAYDTDADAVAIVNSGNMPFLEEGAEELLRKGLDSQQFRASTDATSLALADVVVVVIGTPVDEHLNPDPNAIRAALGTCIDQFRDGQLVILRSTVYPGVTEMMSEFFANQGLHLDLAFCPERIAEGRAMEELRSLPQIVSGTTPRATERARDFFLRLTPETIEMSPMEAEMAKLITNSWRYIKFATANQFFMLATERGLDFERIRRGLTHNYPRAADLPSAGFAAGPCLLKDTMQLAAFSDNTFGLGHSAMLVNEGLPLFIVSQLEKKLDLAQATVGVLGMAFKGESDDIRSSLSYKLKRVLRFRAKEVLCSDPYVSQDADLVSLEETLDRSDALIIGAPHARYSALLGDPRVVNVWGYFDNRSGP